MGEHEDQEFREHIQSKTLEKYGASGLAASGLAEVASEAFKAPKPGYRLVGVVKQVRMEGAYTHYMVQYKTPAGDHRQTTVRISDMAMTAMDKSDMFGHLLSELAKALLESINEESK